MSKASARRGWQTRRRRNAQGKFALGLIVTVLALALTVATHGLLLLLVPVVIVVLVVRRRKRLAARRAPENIPAPAGQRHSRYIPESVKRAVRARDMDMCQNCGIHWDNAPIQFDHKIPHSKGGASTVQNIQLLCANCNASKGDRL